MNLEDIARLSGFSRSTVSRVVNGDPNVKESTRERIQEVIRSVNYRPNIAAQRLASGHSRVIGLVIPVEVSELFTDPYFPVLIQGVSAACNALDHLLMLWLADRQYEGQMIRQILSGGLIEGVVLAAERIREPLIDALHGGDLPYVVIGQHPRLTQATSIDVENVIGAQKAVEHLLALGRRRIGAIAGPSDAVAGIDRLTGYQYALVANGISLQNELIVEGDFSEASGYAAMQTLLRRQVDAVFAASDMMAMGAMRAIHEAGLRIPQDVAVVGFDDMPLAAQLQPPLTTVRQPIRQTGYVAAEILISQIQEPASPPQQVILPTELVIRGSCGGHPV